MTEDQRADLNLDIQAGSTIWRNFNLVFTSYMDFEGADGHLRDKIPYFDDLAILVVDPATMSM